MMGAQEVIGGMGHGQLPGAVGKPADDGGVEQIGEHCVLEAPCLLYTSFWAKSGTLVEWTLADDKPFKPQPGFGDGACGAIMLDGILAALIKRGRTGRGEHIQTSLYSAALWYNSIGRCV